MQLKEYQHRVLVTLQEYLEALRERAEAREKIRAMLGDKEARRRDVPREAWEDVKPERLVWHVRRNGLGESIPDIYFKIPTGGGKTILACHAIDYIQRIYFERQTGLVVWIMPSTEIYRQTARALKNRTHSYRQILDLATGNRVLLREKDERFTRADVEQSLVILLLMLPSANRENKQSLRVFRDSGGFTDFFPPEDQWEEQEKLLNALPNLDFFGDGRDDLLGSSAIAMPIARQIMTSLGNVLRVCRPLIIVDEGHKAWSERARDTIAGLNPRFILQLSATPPQLCNKLVEIGGRDLDREQMIKLPINLQNKRNHTDWKDTLLDAKARRDALEESAYQYRQDGGAYIRPICLIQVQQTGEKLVNDLTKVHAEHARKYLVEQCGVEPRFIKLKTSENDGLEGIDLLAEDCEVRYIITKQALQEGWDCAFAYVLAILTNSGSETGMTQLVGRILRQPYAHDTGVPELDQCYLYTFRQSSHQLAQSIKANLEKEGMGEIAGSVIEEGSEGFGVSGGRHEIQMREKFKHFEGEIYLPKFVVPNEDGTFRDYMYEADILPNIDYSNLNIGPVLEFLPNSQQGAFETNAVIGLGGFGDLDVLAADEERVMVEIDKVYMTRQLGDVDVIPNPWWGFHYTRQIVDALIEKYGEETMTANFVRLIQFAKRKFREQIEERAEQVFRQLITDQKLFFLLLKTNGYCIPNRIAVSVGRALHDPNTLKKAERTLFDPDPETDYNEEEKAVALFLDKQETQLLWWHRNRVGGNNYAIKGYKPQRTWPDFFAAKSDPNNPEAFSQVFIYEYKGEQLRDNADSKYKRNLFDICNRAILGQDFQDKHFSIQMIFKDEYEDIISRDFA